MQKVVYFISPKKQVKDATFLGIVIRVFRFVVLKKRRIYL